MEDGKNLDLCLGLTCGGGSSSAKGKHGSSSENTSDEGDRERKLMNEFKNFLEGGTQHPLKPDKNTYDNNSVGKAVVEIESSRSSASGGMWVTNDSRSEAEIGNKPILGEKRKNVSGDTNQSKKHERESNQSEKTHISITTDEGSTADNEDVADSEVDGSTSRQTSQHDDLPKRFVVSGTQSRVQHKEIHAHGDRNGVELSKQTRFNMSSEKDFNFTNMPYGASFPIQSPNIVNMSYSQPLSGYPVSGMMHAVGGVAATGERPGIQSVMPANFPLMFGYNPVQLPTLDKDNSRATISNHQQMLPTYNGRNQLNSDTRDENRKLAQATMQPVISQMSPEFTQYDRRAVDHAKNNAKHVTEEGSSGLAQCEPKDHTTQDGSRQHRTESVPSEFPAIRPGVTADLKFGGCGSYPNLPWVSTTGPGPNGRTISGVTYRYSPTQIRIVCACHGSHLSPEEFVRHASEDNGTRESVPGLASFPNSNPAASAQS